MPGDGPEAPGKEHQEKPDEHEHQECNAITGFEESGFLPNQA